MPPLSTTCFCILGLHYVGAICQHGDAGACTVCDTLKAKAAVSLLRVRLNREAFVALTSGRLVNPRGAQRPLAEEAR